MESWSQLKFISSWQSVRTRVKNTLWSKEETIFLQRGLDYPKLDSRKTEKLVSFFFKVNFFPKKCRAFPVPTSMHTCIIDALQQMTVCTHSQFESSKQTYSRPRRKKKRENTQTIKCKEPKIVVQKHRLHIYRERGDLWGGDSPHISAHGAL